MHSKAFMSWSGGKDSALALFKAKQQGANVQALVTTVNAVTNRISMHGVRRELLEAQAASIGLPLYTVELPEMPDMKTYEDAVRRTHRRLKDEGFTHGVFGDIFLEDLKRYREDLLKQDGLHCLFPLWSDESTTLMKRFVDTGFKAVVVCINAASLQKDFCGRLLDESFAADLPQAVDSCGENGEYHSFVFDGPLFSKPVAFTKGEIVFKEYPSPVALRVPEDGQAQDNGHVYGEKQAQTNGGDCFTAPQPAAGFWFQDLLPNP